MEWTIQKATDEGYTVLRLYTSDEYGDAAKLYVKNGFVSEPYTLEYNGFLVYSMSLTNKSLELLNGRFMNFTTEIEMCKISTERKREIFDKYSRIKEG